MLIKITTEIKYYTKLYDNEDLSIYLLSMLQVFGE